MQYSIIRSLKECWGPVSGRNGYAIQTFGDITLLYNKLRGFAWCEEDASDMGLVQRMFSHLPLFFYIDEARPELAKNFTGQFYRVPEMLKATAEVEDSPLPADISIQEVPTGDTTLMRIWTTIVAGPNPDAYNQVWDFIGPLVNHKRYVFFLAYWKMLPVATCVVLLGAEPAASLYFVHTHDAYRKRGIGSWISRAAVLKAKEAGYKEVILTSTPVAQNMYKQLGFRTQRTLLEYYVPPVAQSR